MMFSKVKEFFGGLPMRVQMSMLFVVIACIVWATVDPIAFIFSVFGTALLISICVIVFWLLDKIM